MTGETEGTVTCGGQTKAEGRTGGGEEGNRKLSFTTLSTIAIQAGQSQIVISVLKSGSVVHLQLVQVHPGLCEIGLNQEENQTLIQEQQQLVEKLQKHEGEVLSVVEKSQQREQRKRRDKGMMARNKKQEEEEELYKAMKASLSEGWSLLLRLLERRQEVLTLASDFYRRALEFAVSIDRVEDLQIRPDDDRLTEVQLTYDSMRRELLEKSLQVLTSSSVLLQKLRQLQRTEALQRRGGVLQDEEDEEESSQRSRGMALRLEELVETLQDRRRRADQALRLQLQQVENSIMVHKKEQESRQAGFEDWIKILDQNLQSRSTSAENTDLKSDCRPEETRDLQPGSESETRDLQSGFKLNLKISEETTDIPPGSTSEETKTFESGSDLKPGFRLELNPESRAEIRNLLSRFKLNLKPESRSDLILDSKSEETSDLPPGSKSEQTPGSRSDVQPGSGLDQKTESGSDLKHGSRVEFKPGSTAEETRNLQSGFNLNLKVRSGSDLKLDSNLEETRDLLPGLTSDVQPGSGLDLKPDFDSEPTRDVASGSRSEETKNFESGSRLDPKPESRSDLILDLRLEETIDVQPESRPDVQSGSRSDLQPGLRLMLKSESRAEEIRNLLSRFKLNPKTGSRSDLKLDSQSEETRDLLPGSKLDQTPGLRSDMHPGSGLDPKLESGSEQTRDVSPGSSLEDTRNLESGSRLDLKPGSRLEETRDLQPESRPDLQSGSRSVLQPGSRPEETTSLQSGFKLNLKAGSRSDLKSDSKSEETTDPPPDSRLDQTPDIKPGSRSEGTKGLQPGSRSEKTIELLSTFRSDVQPGSKLVLKPGSRSEQTGDFDPELRSEETRYLESAARSYAQPESRLDLKSTFKPDENRNLQSGSTSMESKDLQTGSRSHVKCESRSELKPGSRSEQTRDLWSESRSQETRLETKELQLEPTLDVQPRSSSEKTRDLQPRPRSVLKTGSRSEETRKAEDLSLSELSRKQEEQHRAATTDSISSGQVAGLESMLGKETQSGEDHSHQALLTNQRQQQLSSCEHLVDKIWSWVQQGSSVLSNSSEAGRQLCEAEDTLNTHLQLHTQAESAGHDAENMKQILDQIRALHTESTSRNSLLPPSEPSRQMSPLKALTEQLKRGRASAGPPAADPSDALSPELAGKVDLVLKELQSLNRKIESNLQLLQPYVTFLRTAKQVEEEMGELREIYIRRQQEEEEKEEEMEAGSLRSLMKKKQVDDCWQETLQKFLTAQELGNNYINTVSMVSGAGLDLQSVVSVVQQTVERLSRTKQEVNELRSQQQIQIQQQQEYCRKSRERLLKTLQDLNSVSELLDSCTLMDLGSDLQTSKLLEHFSQARPHFIQLDAEVENIEKSWETLRGVQDRLEVKKLKGTTVNEEDLLELLKLQKKVKNKIDHSESILDMTSSFHLTSQKLDALLQSDPLTGSAGLCGSSEAELSQHREEQQQQIQNLFKMASSLKTDICTAISHSAWTCFRVEKLEARLLSLDSLCASWLNEAARREERLRRELLTCRLNDDINQLRDSFKELKKRFSNLKFNYLKRNDRTRNMKAVRNQLQQVELYKEKLQALRKRLQGVTARLGSEVKDGGVAREAEDAINELQRQMGDFERSVSDHQKTLEMTRKLQQAMEEYQFWCEEASATIARVGKFSSQCRSTEAVSVLSRQFEKFVWPTVPQQEERISQIAELAVRLHGVEEGQRYIEKTVTKHSEMVESIRELSDELMELEAKLKLESLKGQQNDGEKEIKEEGVTEQRRENVTEEKDEEKEKNLKENRKMKKKEQRDNRRSQEAADMYELKETGHTPELPAEHDGKEVPMKRQTAANRKPPLQKSRSLDADRQTVISDSRQQMYSEMCTSSFCSTHTFSLSCSPAEANRRIHTIHSQLQSVETPPPTVIGPLFSDIQREFQKKEVQEMGQQGGPNMTPLQDASAGGLSEAELQQQDTMTEDSFSNDEYDCASPDDISLPPLAETPESFMVPSDVEEGFCFSSHSIHINQYSHQCHVQSEHSRTGSGAVRQQRESSRTESCPTTPARLHSNTRFRSESNSFVKSPMTVPSLVTSTLCSILKTSETSTANIPKSADLSLGGPEPSFSSGSNLVHRSNTPDSCSNKDDDVPEKRSPPQPEPSIKEHNNQYNKPQKRIGTQGNINQNVASKDENLPQTVSIPQAEELNHSPHPAQSSCCPQPYNGPDPPQGTSFLKYSTTFPQTRTSICQDNSFSRSFPDSEGGLHRDMNSSQTRKETLLVSNPQENSLTNTRTSTITPQTIHLQSSPSDSHHTLPQASRSLSLPQGSPLSQSETMPQADPVPQARGSAQYPSFADSVPHKDRTQDTGFLKSCGTCPQTRSGHDQDVPSFQTDKETSSVSMPQSSSLTTAIYCQSSLHCYEPQASSNLRSQQGSPFLKTIGGLREVHAPILPEPNSISNISISSSNITSSNRFSNKQSHQTAYSLHESLTSTCTQQCVHDPGMTPSSPAKPTGPPQAESQTQALAQQANLHVTPLPSPPHLLTPDQDPNICQPVAIREEIRLTPQIQGPSIPAPSTLSQAQAESLPQGKASKPGPPCFTRSLSRATIMGGSPVTLEVEVMAHPEPTLTWFKDGEVSATSPGQAVACEDRKHFLFIPEASDSDGGLYEAQAANHHDVRQPAGNSCSSSGDKWLVAEVFDIISVDWLTWFGTLCVLLWLLYLIVL